MEEYEGSGSTYIGTEEPSTIDQQIDEAENFLVDSDLPGNYYSESSGRFVYKTLTDIRSRIVAMENTPNILQRQAFENKVQKDKELLSLVIERLDQIKIELEFEKKAQELIDDTDLTNNERITALFGENLTVYRALSESRAKYYAMHDSPDGDTPGFQALKDYSYKIEEKEIESELRKIKRKKWLRNLITLGFKTNTKSSKYVH